MKKLLSLFVLIFMGLLVFAQAPQKFSYQAVVRDAGNNLITNHAVGVQISILQGGVNGAVVYMESQTAVTNANGLMTLQIGSGTVLSGDFAAIDWAAGPYFLKTETDPNGGSNYTIAGTQQLLSVPYALYAGNAANSFSGDYNDLTNKPTIPTVPENLSDFNNDLGLATVATTGSYNDLINQPEIPTVPANLSDFNNDLGLATVATTGSYNDLTNIPEEQELSISNDTIYLTGGSFVKLPAATVGFSGDYNDLTNKPTIPTVPANLSDFNNDLGLATVATTGSYNDLTNTPTIPTVPANLSDFNNDLGLATVATTGSYNDLTNKPEEQVLSISNDTIYLTGGSFVKLPAAAVGFSGDYNDLTNKPTIPTVPENLSDFNNDLGLATVATTGSYNDLTNKPEEQVLSISNDTIYLTGGSFVKLPAAAVGFSGDYNDLTNKPTIPTVPENLSDFNNDLGLATVATTGSYNDLTNKPTIPTIPTQVSAFENDAQYLTRDSLSAETDPTVPNWAKESTKPTYDYAEIQNTPTIPTVPENVSVFTNDAGYITTAALPMVNDAALIIQQNGSDLGTFTANQSTEQTVNIVTLTAGDVQALINSSLEPLQQQIDSVQNQNNVLQSRLDDVNFICGTSTVRDYDGNIYNTVKIGNQCWLKENIRTTHYTDGEAIPDGAAYSHIDTDPYRWAPDTNEANVPTYGYLYTWAAVMHGESTSTANPSGVQGICPTGWHVPSNAEWTQLRDYVGSQSQYICGSDNTYIAKALADTMGWNTSSATCAVGNDQSDNNATGFSALPAGERTGAFGSSSRIWSATEYESGNDYSYYITISSSLAFVPSISVHKSAVLSVRCVHDESSVMEQLQDIQEYNDGVQNAMQNHIDSLQNVIDDMNFLCGTSTVRDYDGNIYNTVMIDNQCWLKENMRTTHYANGDTIHDGGTSNSNTIPYRYAPNNDEANVATYGYLYNWTAAMHGASSSTANPSGVQGICPNGWHVPSHAEWTQLTGYVSGQNLYVCGSDYNNISKALADTMGWNTSSNTCAVGNNQRDNNATGFSALPAGYFTGSGYYAFGSNAYFWTATQYSNDGAYYRAIEYSDSAVRIAGRYKYIGYSVRCVRDERSVRDQLQGMQNQIDSFQNVIDGMSFLCGTSTVRDYNGNTYHTVQIGTQCWLKENLKATSYSDGTPISQSNNSSYDTPYWYYPNNSTVNMATYGLLYNWKAVMRDATTSSANPSGVQGICPTGWHVPSSAEWTQLQDYVQTQSQYWCGGDNAKTGKALAAKTNWNTCATTCTVGNSPNDNNATGFSALPAGYRNGTDGNCLDFGGATRFWSTTEDGLYPAYHYYLEYDDTNLLRTTSYKNCGYSVRCIHN